MFRSIQNVGTSGCIERAHNQCLLICDEDKELMLRHCSVSRGNIIFLMPINGAEITLKTPDSETVIDAGDGNVSELTFSGQNIVTLYSEDKWYVSGAVQEKPVVEKRPRGRPRKEPALIG